MAEEAAEAKAKAEAEAEEAEAEAEAEEAEAEAEAAVAEPEVASKYRLRVTMLEIYNEEIHDLLPLPAGATGSGGGGGGACGGADAAAAAAAAKDFSVGGGRAAGDAAGLARRRRALDIRAARDGTVSVPAAAKHEARDPAAVLSLMARGNAARRCVFHCCAFLRLLLLLLNSRLTPLLDYSFPLSLLCVLL
jgi:hypothetical protein